MKSVAMASLVDELGTIRQRLDAAADAAAIAYAKLDADRLRADDLEVQILAAYADNATFDPAAEQLAEGKQFAVKVSARQFRHVPPRNAIVSKLVGARVFAEIATVTLATLKKHLTAEQFGRWVKKDRTGPRTIEVIELPEVARAAK